MNIRILAVAAAAAVTLAACGTSSGKQQSPAAAPASGTLAVKSSPLGDILTDSSGRTIYVFALDSRGHSACTGQCLQYWPMIPAPAAVTPINGISATLGVLVRPDGGRQLTLNGLPAYRYSGDSGPGSTGGQGLNLSGGRWWVVGPSGAEITTGPAQGNPNMGGHGY